MAKWAYMQLNAIKAFIKWYEVANLATKFADFCIPLHEVLEIIIIIRDHNATGPYLPCSSSFQCIFLNKSYWAGKQINNDRHTLDIHSFFLPEALTPAARASAAACSSSVSTPNRSTSSSSSTASAWNYSLLQTGEIEINIFHICAKLLHSNHIKLLIVCQFSIEPKNKQLIWTPKQ
jgi:hypothetical protein